MVKKNTQSGSTTKTALDKPTRSLNQFAWWLKNAMAFEPDVVIDIGASAGTLPLTRTFKNAKHHAFEPQALFLKDLKQELKSLDHETHQIGLMSEAGSLPMTKPVNSTSASFLTDGKASVTSEEYTVSTLDDVFGSSLHGKSVLLKTDCQGADLECLKGGTEVLEDVDVVITPAALYRFWGDKQGDFYDTIEFMKDHGFVPFDMLDGMFRPSNRALGRIELVFVKEHGDLRPNHKW